MDLAHLRAALRTAAAIPARRAELEGVLNAGRLRYADLEAQRDAVLAALADQQRQLDALAGAIQELKRLEETDASLPSS